MEYYKSIYLQTVEDMAFANENPWVVSKVYIFTCLEKFQARLEKVRLYIAWSYLYILYYHFLHRSETYLILR